MITLQPENTIAKNLRGSGTLTWERDGCRLMNSDILEVSPIEGVVMSSAQPFGLSGIQLWPSMLFTRLWDRHAVEAPRIIEYLLQLREKQSARIESRIAVGSKSADGLYESDFDLFLRPTEHLQRLVSFISQSLALAISVANNQEAKPEQIEVEFVDSWYHITNRGGYHDAHVHHSCSWCGIYYLQVGSSGTRTAEGSAPNGGSRFYSPINTGGGYRDFGNKYLTASIDPPVRDGLLLLFPSHLLHSGLPYEGTTDRIVLAFNARALLKEG